MTLTTLFTAVVLTQSVDAPNDFAQRREVKAFLGAPRAAAEFYVATASGFVAAVRATSEGTHAYFVLDALGRVDVAATALLQKCVPKPAAPNPYDAAVVQLLGGRGVVVAETCLVTDQIVPVGPVWGEAWRELAPPAMTAPRLDRDVVRTFRKSAAYRKYAIETLPGIEAVPLPKSPYDLVTVTKAELDFFEPGRQKLFVIEHASGKIHRALTDALEVTLRNEVVSTCGTEGFTAAVNADDVVLTAQLSRGEWEESCQALAWWDPGTRQILVEGHNVQGLLLERMRGGRREARAKAEALWKAGKRVEAIAQWEQQTSVAFDEAEAAELCRTLGQAYAQTDDAVKARRLLQGCLSYQTGRAEAQLLYAAFLQSQNEPAMALAHYEHALLGPLSDEDRARARDALVELELEVAQHALDQSERGAARLHFESLAKAALTPAQARKVRAGLEACESPIRQARWSPR